jgi:predicted ATPase
MPDKPNFFIISGSPGAGKTSIIDKLAARGFATVAEAGRDILREQAAMGGDATHIGDARAFGELMLARGIADYERIADGDEPVFFDRGIAELAGYFRLIGGPIPARVVRAAEIYRTNTMVFLAPPWREIYRQDRERKQDWAEAVRTFELVQDAYIEAGYEPVEIPRYAASTWLRMKLTRRAAARGGQTGFSGWCGSGGSSRPIASPALTSPPRRTIAITPALRTRSPLASRASVAAIRPF